MVGTGILTTSGFTVASVGSHQWAWLLWLVGGLLAICGALAQAELVVRNASTGGDYVILSNAWGPLAGFLSGWGSVVLGFAGPIAASAKASATYLLASFQPAGQPVSKIAVGFLATLLVLTLAWSHSHSHKRSSLTQNSATLIKIIFLATFMFAGLAVGFTSRSLPNDWPATVDTKLTSDSLTSLIYISYAYIGWNSIGYIAGEIRQPQRSLPIAIIAGTLLVTLLYIGLNLVYSFALSATELRQIASSQGFDALAPIAELSARSLFGPTWAKLLGLSVSFMLVASVSAYLLAGPRIIQAMAVAGHFPAWAGRVNSSGIPTHAIWIQSILSLGFIWSTGLESIIVISSVGLTLFSMLTISALFKFRRQIPDTAIAYRCPFFPVVPLIYLFGTGLLTAVTIWNKPDDGVRSLAAILGGIIIYLILTWFAKRSAA